MTAYVLRRIALMIPILLGVSIITFAITALSGSPFDTLELNPRIKPADIQNIKHNLGLDKPILERYFIWLSHVVRGDFGRSLITYQPVRDRILDVMPNTLMLSGISVFLAFFLALPIGILAAVKRNSIFDRLATTGAVAGFAIPTVWLGLLLIILFAVKFNHWGLPSLPVGGVRNLRGNGGLWDRVVHLILPITALTIPQLAGWIVYVRSSMLEVIRQDYIRTAQSKGLKERSVLYIHAFRNAVLPLVTLIGLSIPDVFGGSLVVENVFAYPGMGRLTIDSVGNKDYTMVMGTTIFFAILVIVGNLIADILYVALDPRIKLD
jgi:peptide/nickel transport system permease protein